MMTSKQQFFLNQFEQPFRQNILFCCENISRQNYDVIILLARKAACFLTVLEDLGLVSLNGKVVSDRILMFDTKWLTGKRVAIIDDTIISGTTIGKMIDHLKHIGVSDISVYAFCIDDSWFEDKLLDGKNGSFLHQSYMRVSHSVSIRFCRQIVNALSAISRPYNIDFSINITNSLTSHDFSKIVECSEWNSTETGSVNQYDKNIYCLSLNFKKDFLSKFYAELGGEYSNVMFSKIRIFSRRLSSKNNAGEFENKIVPYVIFNPIKSDFADDIIRSVAESEDIDYETFHNFFETNSSKMFFYPILFC